MPTACLALRLFIKLSLAILALAAVSADLAQAQVLSLTSTTPVARTSGPYTIGSVFQVGSNSVTMDSLGVLDMVNSAANAAAASTGDGLVVAHTVDIWNSGGGVVATINVPSGTAGMLINGFRYAELSAPVTLTAGQTYTIGTVMGGTGNDIFADAYPSSAVTGGPGITITGATYNSGATITFPQSSGGTPVGRWVSSNAANFLLWTGAQSAAWNSSDVNWSGGGAVAYSDGSTVAFNDSASTANTVNFSSANVSPAAVLFDNYGVNYTLQGTYGISGTAGLNKTGSGLVTISNSNAFTGTTTISAGTIQLGNAGALLNSTVSLGVTNGLSFATGTTATTIGGLSGSSSFKLQNGGSNPVTLTVGNNNAPTAYSGVMSGGGGLTKTGSGMLTLSNANTYTGPTTVSGGTLNVSNGIYTSNSTQTITVGSGATLQVSNGNNNPVGWGSGQTWNVAGAINLTAGEVQILPGTLNLNGGTLTSTQTNATYGSYVVYTYNELLTASGSANAITSKDFGINGGYALTLSTPLATDALSASTVFKNGNIAGGALTKAGFGTVVLTGTSTYTGATTVNGGTLYVNGALSNSSSVSVSGGATLGGQGSVGPTTLQTGGILQGGYNGANTLTLSTLSIGNAATINLTPSSLAAIDVTASNGLTANAPAGSVLVNIGTTTLSAGTYPLIDYTGLISGTSGFAAFSIGTKPSDTNVYSLTNNSGVIDLSVALNAPYWSGSMSTAWDTTTQNWGLSSGTGAAVTYSNGVAVVFDDSAGTNGSVVISGTDVAPASVTFNNNALIYTLQGTNAIAGSTGLTKGGTGSLTIGNVNSFTGAVNFNGGTISVGTMAIGGVNSPLGAGTSLTFATGTLEYSGSDAAPTTDRNITLNTGNGTFRVDNVGTMLTLSGSIGGVGGLTVSGPGGITLSNTGNSFSGGVTASGGTLTVPSVANSGVNSPLGAGSSVTLGGAILEYAGVDAAPSTNRGFTLNPGGGTVQVDNAATSLTLAGAIGGSAGLTKSGVGLLALGNVSNSYSGGTTLAGGTLQVAADGSLGTAGTAINIANGATLSYNSAATVHTARPITLGGAATIVNLNNYNLWLDSPISGGSLTIATPANVVILDPESASSMASLTLASGLTYIQNQNSIGTASIVVDSGAIFDVYGGSLSPGNPMTFASGSGIGNRVGTLTLSTANATFPSSGTLNYNTGNAGSNAVINGAYPTLTGLMTFNVAANTLTLSGALTDTGSGSLTKTGGGTLVLNATNTYSGGTTITGGYLQPVNSSAIPGFLTINGGVLQTEGNSYSFNAGSLSFTSGGIQNGSASTSVLITAGADNSSATYGGVLANGGSATLALDKAGSGVLTLNAASTYTGGTTVNGGTLALNIGAAIPSNTALTINNGGYASAIAYNSVHGLSAITINAGGILSADGGAGQAHTLSLNSSPGTLTLNGGTLAGNANFDTTYGQFYFQNSSGGGSIHATGTNQSTISAIVTVEGPLPVNVDAGASLLISGTLGTVAGDGFKPLVKTGGGSLDLTANNGVAAVLYAWPGVTLNAGQVIFANGGLGFTSSTPASKNGTYLADFGGNSTLTWAAGNTQDISAHGNMKIEDGVTATLDTGGNNVTLGTTIVTGSLGTGGLTKVGGGQLTLAAVNTYSGATTVNGGTLTAGAANVLSASSPVTVDLGGTLDVTAGPQTVSSLTIGALGTVNVNDLYPLAVSGSASFVSGSSLDILTSGIVTPDLLMTYAASAGTLSNVYVNGVLGLPAGDSLSYSGGSLEIVSAATSGGTWTQAAGGSWTMGSNWSSNPTAPSSGTVAFPELSSTSAITVTLDAPQSAGALVFSASEGYVLAPGASGSLTLGTSAGGAITVLVGTHTISAPLVLAGSADVAPVAGTQLIISGNISETNGSQSLTLSDAGTLELSGINTYSGGTNVLAGTLVLDTSTALADGSSLTVGQGASSLFAPAAGPSLAAAPAGVVAVPEPGTLMLLLAAVWSAAIYRGFRRRS
jgi:fibronectin-binding autotransporter adhesin